MPADLSSLHPSHEAVLRVIACLEGRAVRAHDQRRVEIHPQAVVLATVAHSGEDRTLHAFTAGPVGADRPTAVASVPDPLDWEAGHTLFDRLADVLDDAIARAARDGVHPQLIVPSPATCRHLTILADDYRHARHAAARRRCGLLLSYFTERAPVDGQQALVPMSSVLATHFVLAMDDEDHLGVQLAQIARQGGDLVGRSRAARRVPMGYQTDPAFDNAVLKPAIFAYRTALRGVLSGATSAATLEVRAAAAQRAIESVPGRMFRATQIALRLFADGEFQALPILPTLRDREEEAFRNFYARYRDGHAAPRRDGAKGGTFRLVEREESRRVVASAVECFDALGRAAGVQHGQVVAGAVIASRARHIPGRRRSAPVLILRTEQADLRVRVRDELVAAASPSLQFVVLGIQQHRDGTTHLELWVRRGTRRPGVPVVGASLTLVHGVPDLHRIGRLRRALRDRLARLPWTHDAAVPLPVPASPPDILQALVDPEHPQHDPLVALEEFR